MLLPIIYMAFQVIACLLFSYPALSILLYVTQFRFGHMLYFKLFGDSYLRSKYCFRSSIVKLPAKNKSTDVGLYGFRALYLRL